MVRVKRDKARVCQICGTQFIGHHRERYCQKCKKVANRAKEKRKYARHLVRYKLKMERYRARRKARMGVPVRQQPRPTAPVQRPVSMVRPPPPAASPRPERPQYSVGF